MKVTTRLILLLSMAAGVVIAVAGRFSFHHLRQRAYTHLARSRTRIALEVPRETASVKGLAVAMLGIDR